MITQEAAVDILMLHRQGFSARNIGRRLGIDRRTVKRYLEDPSVIGQRKKVPRTSVLDPFRDHIKVWLQDDEGVTAQWIFNRLVPLGYPGGYERVKVYCRSLREEMSRIAYIRFETEPAMQAQVDFAEFMVLRTDGTERKYYLFVMVLGYSRMLYAELLEHCDLVSFLDAHIHAFDFFGGVPREVLYDRMKNVYIRRVAGKDHFNDTLVSFSTHYGFAPRVAPAYAPWVKGKVERPIHFVRENFWRGYAFTSMERANLDLLSWSYQTAQRIHGTTHQGVVERFSIERPLLSPLPAVCFDTSYKIFRTVHKDLQVCFDGNRYVAPPHLVGKDVVLRVKNGTIRLFADDILAAVYAVVEGKGHVSDPYHFYDQVRKDREMNQRKYGTGVDVKGKARQTISPSVPLYAAVTVEQRTPKAYNTLIGGEVSYE
jgi:transposase